MFIQDIQNIHWKLQEPAKIPALILSWLYYILSIFNWIRTLTYSFCLTGVPRRVPTCTTCSQPKSTATRSLSAMFSVNLFLSNPHILITYNLLGVGVDCNMHQSAFDTSPFESYHIQSVQLCHYRIVRSQSSPSSFSPEHSWTPSVAFETVTLITCLLYWTWSLLFSIWSDLSTLPISWLIPLAFNQDHNPLPTTQSPQTSTSTNKPLWSLADYCELCWSASNSLAAIVIPIEPWNILVSLMPLNVSTVNATIKTLF
jgi:hypothetical protein